MAEQTYGDWIRSNPPLPTKEYKHMEQTAVNWLMQNIEKTLPNFMKAWRVEFEKAKQMEKEQIMKAVDIGFDEGCKFPEDISLKNAEQYYEQTYKQKHND